MSTFLSIAGHRGGEVDKPAPRRLLFAVLPVLGAALWPLVQPPCSLPGRFLREVDLRIQAHVSMRHASSPP